MSDTVDRQIEDLYQQARDIRLAWTLIRHTGYCPHADDRALPEGHSITSALAVGCEDKDGRDRDRLDLLLSRVAGTLLLTRAPEDVSLRPSDGNVVNIVTGWEGRLTHPGQAEVLDLLYATAEALDAQADAINRRALAAAMLSA
jgi:hypothetical protein